MKYFIAFPGEKPGQTERVLRLSAFFERSKNAETFRLSPVFPVFLPRMRYHASHANVEDVLARRLRRAPRRRSAHPLHGGAHDVCAVRILHSETGFAGAVPEQVRDRSASLFVSAYRAGGRAA